jgi:hypothetical protein
MRRDTPDDVLRLEILEETATSLGRAGRRLEAAIAALERADADRRTALAEARDALWCLAVQREVLGLRDTAGLLGHYRVPPEVSRGIVIETTAWRRSRG